MLCLVFPTPLVDLFSAISEGSHRNFLSRDFATRVNGVLISITRRARAFLPANDELRAMGAVEPDLSGRFLDVTPLLEKYGFKALYDFDPGDPIDFLTSYDQFLPELVKIPWRTICQLHDLGVLHAVLDPPSEQKHSPEKRLNWFRPCWNARLEFGWEQTFPAGKTIEVEHEYTAESGCFTPDNTHFVFERPSARFLQKPPYSTFLQKYSRRYKTSYSKRLYGPLGFDVVEYVLQTANFWQGPIGSFTLRVTKPQHCLACLSNFAEIKDDGKPVWEIKRQNFSPDRDLFLLFVTVPNQ
ncbi:MAG: DUF4424 family protein [Candidatus Riflebacteria bacterium]|nr:DUF4424 family protein [Candidatus Riflebacteria bacterium]